MKKILSTIGIVVVGIIVAVLENNASESTAPQSADSSRRTDTAPATAQGPVAKAFAARRSNQILIDGGRVIKVLPDDNKGSRHQRFLVQMPKGGPSILVAHNIDLAPRVANLREGDRVRFKGEYEWTEKGGVMHWTHHDPRGNHPGGWIERNGERYE